MTDTSERLRQHIYDCADADERAALLTELAELRLSEGNPAAAKVLFQKAYDVRLKRPIAACSDDGQHSCGGDPTVTSADVNLQVPLQPAGALVPSSESAAATAACVSRSSSPASGDWDEADDWEPDLTALHNASSWRQDAASAATDHGQGKPVGAPQSSGGAWRSGIKQAACPGSSSSSHKGPGSAAHLPGSSSGGTPETTPSRLRGRGESRLMDAGSDSDTEWDSTLEAPNQPHIVELYTLNRGVKTSHLDEFLLDYMWGGTSANIKWVDDEHALAVFPCAEAAQQLLSSSQTRYKVRPYSKASGGAMQISLEELTPPRSARPKTTTAVARRLISNALGNREVRDRAAERELANLRKANKQERQQRQQQMESVWEDDD